MRLLFIIILLASSCFSSHKEKQKNENNTTEISQKSEDVYAPDCCFLDLSFDSIAYDKVDLNLIDSLCQVNMILYEPISVWLKDKNEKYSIAYKYKNESNQYAAIVSKYREANGLYSRIYAWLIIDIRSQKYYNFESCSSHPKSIYELRKSIVFRKIDFGEGFFTKNNAGAIFKYDIDDIEIPSLKRLKKEGANCLCK